MGTACDPATRRSDFVTGAILVRAWAWPRTAFPASRLALTARVEADCSAQQAEESAVPWGQSKW